MDNLNTNNVWTVWKCPDCSTESEVPVCDWPEIGTPICGKCDSEMELDYNLKYVPLKKFN